MKKYTTELREEKSTEVQTVEALQGILLQLCEITKVLKGLEYNTQK